MLRKDYNRIMAYCCYAAGCQIDLDVIQTKKGEISLVFAHEYKVKPERPDSKSKRKLSTFPVAPAAPERSCFYNKSLSQSFGSRFSFEKFKK